jgi:hypothetical protein
VLEQVRCDPGKPEHVLEIQRLVFARLHGESLWTRELLQRIAGGDYAFAGEPSTGFFPPDPRESAVVGTEARSGRQ